MVREISVRNKAGITAKCFYKQIAIKKEKVEESEYRNVRILKHGNSYSASSILSKMSVENYIDGLIKNEISDIDIQSVGTIIGKCNKVITNDNQIVSDFVKKIKIVNEKEEVIKNEEFTDTPANVNEELPLVISDTIFTKENLCTKLFLSRKIQLIHKDDLTFKFLMDLAEEIGDKIVMVGSGKKGTKPIIFAKNGTPYRGFLQASIVEKSYKLVVHLSNMEISNPQKVKDENY